MAIRKIKNSWWVDIRADYTRYRKRSPENSKAGAQAYEATLRQRLARGEPLHRVAPPPLFEEFAGQWLRDYVAANNKFSSERAKRGTLKTHLVPFFGRLRVDAITTHHVEQFKARQVKKGLSGKTIKNHLAVLGKCLVCAHEWLELTRPLPAMRAPKCAPPPTEYLSPDECELLLVHTTGVIHELVLTALRTGMRQGELKGLQWQSIDWESRTLSVRHSFCDVRKVLDTTKSTRERHIPLDIDVLTMLHRRKQGAGYVFLNGWRPFDSTRINRQLAEACEKAGVRKITWHVLRHTFATHAAMKGIPLQIVQHLLGHSTVKTTERYAHVAPSMLRTAIDMLNPKTQRDRCFGQPVGNQWGLEQFEEGARLAT